MSAGAFSASSRRCELSPFFAHYLANECKHLIATVVALQAVSFGTILVLMVSVCLRTLEGGVSLFATVKARRVAVALCLSVIALSTFSSWFIQRYFWLEASNLAERLWPPPTAAQVEQKNLRRIAGWFSLDCGHVRYRQDAEAAIDCAHRALKAGQRFYVSFDGRGLDSHLIAGVAVDSHGAVFEVFTDEMPGVRGYNDNIGIGRTITITRCVLGSVEEVSTFYGRNRYLQCRPSE